MHRPDRQPVGFHSPLLSGHFQPAQKENNLTAKRLQSRNTNILAFFTNCFYNKSLADSPCPWGIAPPTGASEITPPVRELMLIYFWTSSFAFKCCASAGNMAISAVSLVWECVTLGNVLLALALLYLLHILNEFYEFKGMPPGPRLTSLPFIGSFHSFDAKSDSFKDSTRRLVLLERRVFCGGLIISHKFT